MRIEPRESENWLLVLGVPILSAIVALMLAAIPLSFAGANLIVAYVEMFKGVFGLCVNTHRGYGLDSYFSRTAKDTSSVISLSPGIEIEISLSTLGSSTCL